MMERKGFRSALNNINEHFASVWTLMSDTTIFLSNNTKIFRHYETQLRELRHLLESNRKNPEVIHDVRRDLVAIRKSLRMQGYNLRLGSMDLKLQGFRNDEAIAEGFTRCVLFLLEDGDVVYITGTANHIELDSALESRMAAVGYRPVSQKHYLWFKWANRVLLLSGAASESRDDFEDLKDYVEEHRGRLVQKLAKMS